jgi:hypothetical protein
MIYQHENMDVERDMQLLRQPWEALQRFPRLQKNSDFTSGEYFAEQQMGSLHELSSGKLT